MAKRVRMKAAMTTRKARKGQPVGPAQGPDVFAVATSGRGVLRFRLVECRAGGWRWYDNVDTGRRFCTRAWYPHTTPVQALLHSARADVGLARDCVVPNRRAHLLDRALNAINAVERRDWPAAWGCGGRY